MIETSGESRLATFRARAAQLASKWRIATQGLTSQRIRAILALGCVLGLGAVGTTARWSDEAVATSGIFSTGSIDLQLNSDQGNPTAYAFATLSKTGMKPGNSVAATLPVQNKGPLPFTYSMATVATGGLANHLTVAVYSGGVASNTATAGSCTGTAVVGPTSLNGAAVPSRGPLAATNGTETLCFVIALSPIAPISAQSATASATFTFSATAS